MHVFIGHELPVVLQSSLKQSRMRERSDRTCVSIKWVGRCQ